jgi:hypothetical protein
MSTKSHRRWRSFSLRTLFIAVTLVGLAVWLGPDVWRVYQRRSMRNWIEDQGGSLQSFAELEAIIEDQGLRSFAELKAIYGINLPHPVELSHLRRWLGDELYFQITVEFGSSLMDESEQIKATFPEALLLIE